MFIFRNEPADSPQKKYRLIRFFNRPEWYLVFLLIILVSIIITSALRILKVETKNREAENFDEQCKIYMFNQLVQECKLKTKGMQSFNTTSNETLPTIDWPIDWPFINCVLFKGVNKDPKSGEVNSSSLANVSSKTIDDKKLVSIIDKGKESKGHTILNATFEKQDMSNTSGHLRSTVAKNGNIYVSPSTESVEMVFDKTDERSDPVSHTSSIHRMFTIVRDSTKDLHV